MSTTYAEIMKFIKIGIITSLIALVWSIVIYIDARVSVGGYAEPMVQEQLDNSIP